MSDLNQIYDALLRIERGQGALAAEVKGLGQRFDSHVIDDRLVEARVDGLENREAHAKGIAAALGSAAGVLVTVASSWLGLHR